MNKDAAVPRRQFLLMMTVLPCALMAGPGELRAAKGTGREIVNRLEIERLESSRPRRDRRMTCGILGDKTTLYRTSGGRKIPVFGMNDTGRAVWDLCDGNHGFREICREIAERFETTEIHARRDVRAFISGLNRCGAVIL